MLLQDGADKEAETKLCWTPLYIAAKNGHIATITALIQAGANKEGKTKHGLTPLHAAAANGHIAAIAALIQAGANKEATTNDGSTPLHSAAGSALIQARADKGAKAKDGAPPLHSVAQNGHAAVISALIQAGANKEAKTKNGRTPLHEATHYGCTAAIAALLQAGANKEATTNDGSPPLHIAADGGNAAAISSLIQAGAEKEAEDNKELTPLDVASMRGRVASIYALIKGGAKKDFTLLFQIIKENKAEVFMAFYDLGARVISQHESLTEDPKMLAFRDLLDLILDIKKSEKPNAHASTEERAKLLFFSAVSGYDILVKRLLVNPNLALDQNENGDTALHSVAKKIKNLGVNIKESPSLKNCVNLLLRVSNLECKNAAGKTAYDEGNELFRSMVDEMRIKKALAWSLKTVGVNVTKDQVCGIPADVRKIILSYLTKHAWLPGYLLNSSTSENPKLNTLARGQKD